MAFPVMLSLYLRFWKRSTEEICIIICRLMLVDPVMSISFYIPLMLSNVGFLNLRALVNYHLMSSIEYIKTRIHCYNMPDN